MINTQKTRLMTKCAIYEKHEGKEDITMSRYFKSDYVRLHVVKTIIYVTIGFAALWGLHFIYKMDYYIANALSIDYKSYGLQLLGSYVLLLGVYVGVCWVWYSAKYRRSRARLGKYYKILGKINKLNEKDERIKDLEEW